MSIVEDDLACVGCGYKLRMQGVEGRCPECNLAVGVTLAALRFPRELYRRFPHGCWMMVGSELPLPILDVVFRVTSGLFGYATPFFVFDSWNVATAMRAVVCTIALFFLTVPAEGRGAQDLRRAAVPLRFIGVIWLVASLAACAARLLWVSETVGAHGGARSSTMNDPWIAGTAWASVALEIVMTALLCVWLWRLLKMVNARFTAGSIIGVQVIWWLVNTGEFVMADMGVGRAFWNSGWAICVLILQYFVLLTMSLLWIVLALRFRAWARTTVRPTL